MIIFDGALTNIGYPGRKNILLIPCGLPGCGKTTALNQWKDDDPEHRVIVGRDDMRNLLGCLPVGTRYQENSITAFLTGGVASLLQNGWDVGVDSTHIQPGTLEHWVELAQVVGVKHKILDLTHLPIGECIRRDEFRKENGGRYVGGDVIRMMAAKYLGHHPGHHDDDQ